MTNVNSAVQIIAQTDETKVAVINLLVSCISEDRQIDLNDIDIKVEELPKETRKMISEKIFPRDFLRSYHRIREAAEAELDKDGSITTPMGSINSRRSAIEKLAELKKLKAAWNEQLEVDAPKYVDMCREHLLAIGQVAIKEGADPVLVAKLTDYLMKRQPNWEQVVASLKFGYVVTVISLDEGDFDPELMGAQRDSVVALRDGVMGALVQSVCKEALAILKLLGEKDRSTQHGQYKLNPRTVRRSQEMVKKLEPLAFIHPLIKPLHDAVKAEMDKLPGSGVLTGTEFSNFEQCLIALRDQTLVWERLQKGLPLIAITPLAIATAAVGAAHANLGTFPSQQSQLVLSTQPAVAAPAVTAEATPVAPVVEVQQEEAAPAVESSKTEPVEQPGTPDLFNWL